MEKNENTAKTPINTSSSKVEKKKVPFWAFLVFGCLGVFVVSGVIFSLAGKLLLSGVGKSLVQKGIENKTGIKINTEEGKEGLQFTDTKTGAQVNIGAQKIPDDFPKDFPIYPGSKPSGSLSGSKQEDNKGFWLVLSTPDNLPKVEKYYTDSLKGQGWGGKETIRLGNSITWEVSKSGLSGTVSVSQEKEGKETSIMVVLGNKNAESSEETPNE